MNKTVSIFGGTGFVGTAIAKKLLDKGYIVNILSRESVNRKRAKILKGTGGQFNHIKVNYDTNASIEKAIKGSDYVINLIGILYQKPKQKFEKIHGELAENLAKIAKKVGVKKFVHISALGIESSYKSSKYARSKISGERGVHLQFPHATILRPSVIFGEEDNFLNQFAAMAGKSPFLPNIGGGEAKFQPVWVEDVADSVIKVLENAHEGKVYELVGHTRYSFKQILKFILKSINKNRVLMPLPYGLAKIPAFFLELTPNPMLTMDQVELLKYDNVSEKNDMAKLGIKPSDMEDIAGKYLKKHRKK